MFKHVVRISCLAVLLITSFAAAQPTKAADNYYWLWSTVPNTARVCERTNFSHSASFSANAPQDAWLSERLSTNGRQWSAPITGTVAVGYSFGEVPLGYNFNVSLQYPYTFAREDTLYLRGGFATSRSTITVTCYSATTMDIQIINEDF
jgi:hypothetical protein